MRTCPAFNKHSVQACPPITAAAFLRTGAFDRISDPARFAILAIVARLHSVAA